MKNDEKTDDLKFQRIMDAISDSILEASDEEILEEMVLAGEDSEAVAKEVKDVLYGALLKHKKHRLPELEQQHAEQLAHLEGKIVNIPEAPKERRNLLEKILGIKPDFRQLVLTAQYRDLSEIDDQAIEEHLREWAQLGVLDDLDI